MMSFFCRWVSSFNKLVDLVGVTLGPKGRTVVLESKYGPPEIVNDGVIVSKEVRCGFVFVRICAFYIFVLPH